MKSVSLVVLLLFAPIIGVAEVGGEYRGKMYDIENEERVVDAENLKVLELTLWDADISDSQSKIGASPVKESGVGSGHHGQICYEGTTGILILEFPYQRYPPRHLQNVILSSNKRIDELFAVCTPNPKVNKNLTIAGGLRLGMSRAGVQRIWGKPGKITPKVFIYEIRRIQKDYFTDDVSIYLEFENDKLSFALVSRTAIQ